ncbi:MAG TPA: M20 family metallopeptidase [Candidatus Hydrogenedentes bacterium]|nr:M20 family metallopeptidase [Candidatus Hydrogenedentota bacterium]
MIPKQLTDTISGILPEIEALRHELHQHPEIRFEEHWTSERISRFLKEANIPFTRGHARGTGICALIHGEKEGPEVALRADMDALEIQEETTLPYASILPGRMHACGHDGHLAILCGVAKTLLHLRNHIQGTVKLLFQPAEEQAGGGRLMVEEGLLNGVSAVFALHGWPNLPAGKAAAKSGCLMAGADFFKIEIHGRGGHGADPANAIDPILAAAHIITALQSLVAREIDPWDAAVITVAHIEAGATSNIIPDHARMEGTCRALTPETRLRLIQAIERVAANTALAFRAHAEFTLGTDGYPPLYNHPEMSALAREAILETFGNDGVWELNRPCMTSEDFAFYLERTPGAYILLGTGGPHPLHTPHFDFNDAVMPHAIELMCRIAFRALQLPQI